MKLPETFEHRMKKQLQEEYEEYLKAFEKPETSGIRINTLKTTPEEFAKKSPFSLRQIPWISNGFYYDSNVSPAKHPYYYAGLYYIQEPSAMTPANLLLVQPGHRVLDLCAAPGGKSTELAAKLCGEGVLVANDISSSRAKALLKNLEIAGVKNAVVVSESPARLAEVFKEYFDSILVDAPCSGEGMFRKSPQIIKNWEQYGVDYYYQLQKEILPFAVSMLRPGGRLLYSTCTFSPTEDEGTTGWLLSKYPELSLVSVITEPRFEGFSLGRPDWTPEGIRQIFRETGEEQRLEDLTKTIRLWPHKLEGEGHFLACFQKSGEVQKESNFALQKETSKLTEETKNFLETLTCEIDYSKIVVRQDRVFLLPKDLPDLTGLRILRNGLLLGEQKKGRFEPSQALACAITSKEYKNCYNLASNEEEVYRYLKCESIELKNTCQDGFVLIQTDGWSLGWGKVKNGKFKNKYLPGWRMM